MLLRTLSNIVVGLVAGIATLPAQVRAAASAPATRPAVAQALRDALVDGAKLLESGKPGDCRLRYERACAEAIASVGADSDAGSVLTRSIAAARSESDDTTAVGVLSAGMNEAAAAVGFKPIMEASLPKGFPAPGPVGAVAVKEYPAYRMARTPMSKEAGEDRAFGVLFRHIQSNKIEMTAPVELGYERRGQDGVAPQSMAFMYGSPETGNAGKDAKDVKVEVVDVPAQSVVSIGVRGAYTTQRMQDALGQLDAWLAKHPDDYAKAGEPRYLGYNSPFILPWLRYGEVQVPVKRK